MYLVVLLLIIFSLSSYFNAIETAYMAFDRILITGWLRARKWGARSVHFLSSKPQRFLNSALIAQNICDVAYSSLAVIIANTFAFREIWVIILLPPLALVFTQLLPKMAGFSLANLIVRWLSLPLLIAYYATIPINLLLHPITRILGKHAPDTDPKDLGKKSRWSHADLEQILVGAEAEGTLSPDEGVILARYLDARELKVRQIMTPRTEIEAVPDNATPDDIRDAFRRTGHDFLPVYQDDLDHIIGLVAAKQFLTEIDSVSRVIFPIHAVPESKRIVDLLQEFKTEKRQIALVIDEHGGTDGLVTLKDIFEELVGPVAESWDPDHPVIKRIAAGKFLVSGSAYLEDIESETGWQPPDVEANTFSGMLAEHLGRIADAGEDIDFNGVMVRVIKRSPRRVEGCLLRIPKPARRVENADG